MTSRRILNIFCVAALFVAGQGQAQHAYRQLREFGFAERAASQPLSGLAVAPDGWVYAPARAAMEASFTG